MLDVINACRSESPSKVFLIVIVWLYQTLKDVPPDKWGEVILAYDNMCQLDSLRAAKQPLALAKPYDLMWQKITKVYIIYIIIMT